MRVSASTRATVQRLTLPLLIFVSALLAVLGKADVLLFDHVRIVLADTLAPVLRVAGEPIATVSKAIGTVEDIATVYRQNQELKVENQRLLQWQDVARRLESENEELRNLVKFAPQGAVSSVAAQVIADSGGAFLRNVLINVGRSDGVSRGQPALTGDGLVGRVIELGDRSARVLLLTDINSHIPVVVEGTHERAMLNGDNSDQPRLVYLQPKTPVKPGDRIVTSGSGGLFPPDLPVGVVVSVNGMVRVEPYADLARLEMVRIVNYGLDGVLPEGAIPAPLSIGGGRARATPAR
ncbi:MAG: rod shape-determining protein MreC [Alphaproteobacteria bacterium]|nr:rod shape-determining protein MreC [Alphaproteobacteria bacterium]